ncbi:DUF6668 family protein [Streptomyces sp. NPDC057909]|uniref:DUF6668 family protein n=1 Tax=Streptomyces sp. NPDC057909 TaxID=3346277 RepID=UPI0036E57CD2
MSESGNPWVTPATTVPRHQVPPVSAEPSPQPLRSHIRPQPGGVDAPPVALPGRDAQGSARWWWLGCHGGAGVTSLAAAVPGGDDSSRCWPLSKTTRQRVVLVTRSHAAGLQATQWAARQWASGSLPSVELMGLVVVADAPGRLPAPLRDLVRLVSGGVPRTWSVPWIEAWRLGQPADALPREVAKLAKDLTLLTESEIPR